MRRYLFKDGIAPWIEPGKRRNQRHQPGVDQHAIFTNACNGNGLNAIVRTTGFDDHILQGFEQTLCRNREVGRASGGWATAAGNHPATHVHHHNFGICASDVHSQDSRST